MNENLKALSAAGVSIWLDDLSRERIDSGNLADLIKNHHVVGVTTNPTIFAQALAKGIGYSERITTLGSADVSEVMWALMIDDVRDACDLLFDVYRESGGFDGRVSIEVDPTFAHDTQKTVVMAKELWAKVDRPNLLIKIPATEQGLAAVTECIANGISVNVTLIFGIDRYEKVIDAYWIGLEKAAENGIDLGGIHSVASFFVSRVDTDVDAQLSKLGRPELGGAAAVANARLAHETFVKMHDQDRWQNLAQRGANVQRPLWASTGVKNPNYPDTLYVSELVVANSVNTMPESTLLAFADHGPAPRDLVTGNYSDAKKLFAEIAAIGVSYSDLTERLEREGLQKFVESWTELQSTVGQALAK